MGWEPGLQAQPQPHEGAGNLLGPLPPSLPIALMRPPSLPSPSPSARAQHSAERGHLLTAAERARVAASPT